MADPAETLFALADAVASPAERGEWLATLRGRDEEREREIAGQAKGEGELTDPVHLLRTVEGTLGDATVPRG